MMSLWLIGFGVIFGMSALFSLPWLADVLRGRFALLIGVLVLLGFVAFIGWSVQKIRKRQRQSAE
ncbi:hypothetical protein Sros_6647 [Streptosporangium roseum DSM 43021]|uniref:Uncharacterized protein n=2 Tax=Streptosporangium roseum TaxID=2001 RepID=D2B3S2_STRRD|nr:hypothetical protein Sros_6647 [Streptosporangium roseum DSM 43021]